MKKLTLVAAIAAIAASGTLSAATIYEKGSVTWKMDADVQVQFKKKVGSDQDLDIDYDDSELKNKFHYKLSNGWTAFAETHYDFKKAKTEETFVGIDFGTAKLLVGDTTTASDSFGVEKELDLGVVKGDAFPSSGESSDDLVKLYFDAGPVKVIASHEIKGSIDEKAVNEDDATKEADSGQTSTDILLSLPVGGAEIQVAYQTLTAISVTNAVVTKADTDTLGFAVKGKIGSLGVGLAYSSADVDGADDSTDVTHLALTHSGFGVGFETYDESGAAKKVQSWYANYTHKLAKNVTTFVEIGDDNQDGSNVGYIAGMRVKF